jgi:hypothetical protein
MEKEKKTVHQLRDEILLAHRFFRNVSIECDHIVCTIDYSIKGFDENKQKLKKYIQTTFDKVLHVDLFSDYFVVWHHPNTVEKEHRITKKVYLNENGE